MKTYKNSNPKFSDSIEIIEPTDTNHADNVTAADIQNFQNTLANRMILEGLFGFTYEGNGLLNNILGSVRDGETLIIPAGMGSVEDDTLILTGGIPYVPTAGSSGGSDYVLPAATALTLGGVKIGDGVNVKQDGTISVNLSESAEKVASLVEANTEDFSDEEMSDLLKLV